MIARYHFARAVAKRIASAADQSVDALNKGRVEHEPAMTDRMLGAIEQSMDGSIVKGIVWSAKTLTDRGRGSQESRFGADFMGVLNIDLPDMSVSKGFLAQAKLVRNDEIDNPRELTRQCEKMLKFSPDSFVFLYHQSGIRIVSALTVVQTTVDPWALSHRSVQRFFEEHLQCYFGDGDIQASTPATLNVLQRKYEARTGIVLQASLAKARTRKK